MPAPTNVAVVLLDSLNRHMIGAYGGDEFDTPNLDRFARDRAVRFTNHVTGSMPCMPARHDILCGAYDFLWKPWGSIELWEESVVAALHRAGVTSMLVSDHPHLFETGGENYHTDFDGWDYVRGHEGDPWRTYSDPSWIGEPERPARPAVTGGWFWNRVAGMDVERAYDRSRTFFRSEDEFPGPRTMAAAAHWLREATPHHDGWFLFVDEFDPHEPFDTPPEWTARYQDDWDGDQLIWPPYAVGAIARDQLTEAEGANVRANYGAKLSMIDHWFGRILDVFDERNLWDDTALIVCTDHGHYLGEQRLGGSDIWGKPAVPQFEPIGHIPFLVAWPGRDGGDVVDALTTNVDVHATLLDVFEVMAPHRTHGRSLVPLLDGTATSVRDWALGGVFGSWVQVTDGRRKYARAPETDGFPLSMWSNRWSSMPLHVAGIEGLPKPDDRAFLDRMPGSTVPVIRQPFRPGDMVPMWASGASHVGEHHCYDLDIDPDEQENRLGGADEREMLDLLRTAVGAVDASEDQYQRLGLA